MSNYPDGVTDADIDCYFGEDETVRCETCRYYDDGFCMLNIQYAEEQEEWSQEEKEQYAYTDAEDYCDSYERGHYDEY